MRKRIATLEVLAIGGIIALSAAAVTPMVIATDHANTMKCIANGKKIMAGMQQYMADYDGRFPSQISGWSESAYTQANNKLKSMTWSYAWDGVPSGWNAATMGEFRYISLRNYVKDDSVWVCPAAPGLYNKRYAYGFRCSWLPRSSDQFVNGDRGFCKSVTIPWPSDPGHNGSVGLTIAEVQALDAASASGPRHMPPHKKIMFMCYSLGRWGTGMFPPNPPPWNRLTFPQYAHADGSVFAYADGHVEWKKMGMGWAPLRYTADYVDSRQ